MTGSHAEIRRYALKLLHYRFRSENEMIQRLKRKGFSNDQINNTIEYLKDSGLINDKVLAPELIRNAVEIRHLGRKGVKTFLYNRGIKEDLIIETLSGFSEDTEKEAALRFVKKRMRVLKNYPLNTIRRRLWGMLERRGFSADTINVAIKSIEET